jgi:glycerate kinase
VRILVAPDKFKGSLTATAAAGYERVMITVTGRTGEPVTADFAFSGDTAVVEMAEASGLRRLPGGDADLVITGEGSLDQQSLAGKAPRGGAQAAARASASVVALVGRSALTADEANAAGFAEVHALTEIEPDLQRCQRDAASLLTSLAQRLAETSPLLGAGEAAGDSRTSATADSTHRP